MSFIFFQSARLVVITIYFFTLLFQLLFRYKCNNGVSQYGWKISPQIRNDPLR